MDRLTLDAVRCELERGRVYEVSLHAKGWHLDGLCEGEVIYIDPRPAIIESVVHEVLHRMRPRWGENRVLRESRRLLAAMSGDELAGLWRLYLRTKKRGRRKVVDDDAE